jgi:hypothetical protein
MSFDLRGLVGLLTGLLVSAPVGVALWSLSPLYGVLLVVLDVAVAVGFIRKQISE